MDKAHITAVLPARDEALVIGQVLTDLQAQKAPDGSSLIAQIIVCDNGSSDSTAEIAEQMGVKVVYQSSPGYGIACLTALAAIDQTDIVLFVDADGSLDLNETASLIEAIIKGADLVIGAREADLQQAGAMTVPQRFGNWLASALIRIIWRQQVTDLGPFRAIRYSSLKRLVMSDPRYGWTVEMQVKAIQHEMTIQEVPVHYRRRIGKSKISGTLHGVIGAGIGIISTIVKLALNPPGKRHQNPAPNQTPIRADRMTCSSHKE